MDGSVNLADAILALKVLTRIDSDVAIHPEADVDGNGKIGIRDIIYILRKILMS